MRVPVVTMGFLSILLQITVLRLLLSAFSGNELDIGITLSFWLLYAGAGSFAGRKIRRRHPLSLSFICIALISMPTVLAIKAIRPALSLAPGEMISFASTLLSTAIILLPVSFLIGLQFPLAVSFWKDDGTPGRIYGLEALGAFIGGMLFTFVLSSRIDSMTLCLIVSLVSICTAASVTKKKGLLLIGVIPLLLYVSFDTVADMLPWKGLRVVDTVESRYGEITVVRVGMQSSIYSNGHLMFTYPDLQTEELKVHLPMALHPTASRIIVIGGSPGVLKEFLKYPVECIDFIELDPTIIAVFQRLMTTEEDKAAMKNRKVRILTQDGRTFIKKVKKPSYDLVILSIPHPFTAGINRFYTIDFFKEVKAVLKKDGVLALSLPASSGYIGRQMQTANGTIYNSLKSVFGFVEVTSQEYGGLFASESAIEMRPEILEKRFMQQKIATEHFHPYLFQDAFSQLDTEYVRQRLSRIQSVNTDMRPAAYLYNLMLWTQVHGGTVLSRITMLKERYILIGTGLFLALALLVIFNKKNRILLFSVFTTGFSGMSFVLATLLAYQAVYGYVYEMIGALSAFFMIGLWGGTFIAKQPKNPPAILLMLETLTILLVLVSPFLFKAEFFFYGLIFISGMLTGAQFSAASLSFGERESGGTLYAIDLFGSFLGAFVPSIIIIPLFGIAHALLFIAFLKLFSAVMIAKIAIKNS
jgi:spermidine synthase